MWYRSPLLLWYCWNKQEKFLFIKNKNTGRWSISFLNSYFELWWEITKFQEEINSTKQKLLQAEDRRVRERQAFSISWKQVLGKQEMGHYCLFNKWQLSGNGSIENSQGLPQILTFMAIVLQRDQNAKTFWAKASISLFSHRKRNLSWKLTRPSTSSSSCGRAPVSKHRCLLSVCTEADGFWPVRDLQMTGGNYFRGRLFVNNRNSIQTGVKRKRKVMALHS